MTVSFSVSGRLLLPGNSLVSGLCRRIDTPFKEEGKGHRRTRFIRTMKRNTRNREKMWAGQTAPFFACRKARSKDRSLRRRPQARRSCRRLRSFDLSIPEKQKGPQGAFSRTRGNQRSRSFSLLPTDLLSTRSNASASGIDSFFSVMFGQISARSTFS